jgi:hemerythrin-like domain-containing protein
MKPTEILSEEHRVIQLVLDCLEKMADDAERQQRVDPQDAAEAIDFFRNFADGCHHAKEENQLFPAMQRKGFSPETGPVAVMLYEHTVGREAVRGMDREIGEQEKGDPQAAQRFVAHARRFITLLRDHIEKEDHCLFAMADQAFSDQDQAELLERFEQAEREVIGSATKEKYLALADRLADRYSVSTT